MKSPIKFLTAVIGCEAVGLLATPFTIAAIPTWYAGLERPFFSPPNWVFGPVWTLLYFMMGVSVYLIWIQGTKQKQVKTALTLFLAQLALNFLWSFLFFGLRNPFLGLVDIVALWFLIVQTIRLFRPLSKLAAYLLVPYLLWVSFATLLNAAIFWLN